MTLRKLDLRKAFDTLYQSAVVQTLQESDLPRKITRLVSLSLSEAVGSVMQPVLRSYAQQNQCCVEAFLAVKRIFLANTDLTPIENIPQLHKRESTLGGGDVDSDQT